MKSEELFQAINLASRLHRSQTRRDSSRTPYISHLVSVAFILSEHTSDMNVIQAGLLHDCLEDVEGYNQDALALDTNPIIAKLVYGVSHDSHDDHGVPHSWLTQKQIYIQKLRDGDQRTALISAADKIHNIKSFLFDYENEGEPFRQNFAGSSTNQIWFYKEVLSVAKEKLGDTHALVILLEDSLNKFTQTFKAHN